MQQPTTLEVESRGRSRQPLSLPNLAALRQAAGTSDEIKSATAFAHSLEQPIVLLTNGIGGMARLCVNFGAIKSKYDCLLGANLNPRVPVDRHILAKRARLWINADGFITPLDLRNLVSFQPGPPAVWYFIANAGDGRTVEIQISANMLQLRNTTALHFSRPTKCLSTHKPLPDNCEVRLTVRVDIEDRNFHWETKRNGGADQHFASNTKRLPNEIGFAFTPAPDRQLRVYASSGLYHDAPEWCENIPHPVEQSRAQTASGDAYSPGWFELTMPKGAYISLVACADAQNPTPNEVQRSSLGLQPGDSSPSPLPPGEGRGLGRGEGAGAAQLAASPSPSVSEPPPKRRKGAAKARPQTLAPIGGEGEGEGAAQPTAKPIFAPDDEFGQQLLRAAQAFVVRRDDGITVIAGYPWFLDWGRDSLICARGLLAAGMIDEVKQLLMVFGKFEKDGTLPNTIHGDDATNRDTTDAPLWYGVVCEEVAERLGPEFYQTKVSDRQTLAQVLQSFADNFIKGTPNQIKMDFNSGLIWSPSHFTWMDTNFPAGTPREGYPVEIQVLWIRLLRQLQRISDKKETRRWSDLADQAEASLMKYFWIEDRGYFADLLIAKPGKSAAEAIQDNALRSNCLFAVSLGLVTGQAAQRCVAAAIRYLVVPGALRTVAPLPVSPPLAIYGNQGQLLNNPPEPYWGRYEGDEDTRRKPSYHNGTAWTWTFAVFCEALARAWNGAPEALAAARAYLGSMDRQLMAGCVGQIPEIIDGDAPHTQRGCDAQAWGVTEALRVWKFLQG